MRAWKALFASMLVVPPLVHGTGPTEWPLERIVGNLEKGLASDPGDAAAHYSLGRAHAFAFALKRSSLFVYASWEGSQRPKIADLDEQDMAVPPRPGEPALPATAPVDFLAHLAPGVQHLRRACEREPWE